MIRKQDWLTLATEEQRLFASDTLLREFIVQGPNTQLATSELYLLADIRLNMLDLSEHLEKL